MGGEELALPAAPCSLLRRRIFFAILKSLAGQNAPSAWKTRRGGFPRVKESGLLDLSKIEFNRGGTAKNSDRDTHLAFLVIDFFDVAVEIRERTFLDANHFANFEKNLGTGLFNALFHLG